MTLLSFVVTINWSTATLSLKVLSVVEVVIVLVALTKNHGATNPLKESVISRTNEKLPTVLGAKFQKVQERVPEVTREQLLPERETRLAQLVIATVNVLLAQ